MTPNEATSKSKARLGNVLQRPEAREEELEVQLAEDVDFPIVEDFLKTETQRSARIANDIEESVLTLTNELIENVKEERKFRKSLVTWVGIGTGVWLLLLLSIIVLIGTEVFSLDLEISKALITTATITVVGLLSVIVAYYFTQRNLIKETFGKIIDRRT